MKNSELLLGYDYDYWIDYGKRKPIRVDISQTNNSHILLCGMSGSGKSYAENLLLGRFAQQEGIIYFADFKQDDAFSHLRECTHYYPYNRSIDALNIVYENLHKRQLGEDTSRTPITLIWDEYMANILALQGESKKKADDVMRKVSEILMLGRSLGIRLVISCQRPDASAFPSGSRLNYGIIIIVGASIKSIYEMLLPREYIELIGNRRFGRGEGVLLLQGSDLRFIKVPAVANMDKLKRVCITALGNKGEITGDGVAVSPTVDHSITKTVHKPPQSPIKSRLPGVYSK